MKRRRFGILTGGVFGAVASYGAQIEDANAAADPSLLTTTLTPFGAERAGNAAGTIPAWTGGMTATPPGIDWDPSKTLPPDFFAADAALYTIDAANMGQYSAILTDGQKYMIQNYGFSLQVFPTHRTAAAPQWVYDNIAQNVTRAALNPNGGRLGFTGGYGGAPFPIPDISDPLAAGAQIVWNHETRWGGPNLNLTSTGYVVVNGVVSITQCLRTNYTYPYYQQGGSPDDFGGYIYKVYAFQLEPATAVGQQIVSYNSTNPLAQPNITWELLSGQGRVRKAPDVEYDVPNSYNEGIINYDEVYAFNGALDEYDWKCLGKQEVLIPYNNNKLFNVSHATALGPKFMNPEVVRWELHRVWVVEATLHPGKRNVLVRRKLYIDEDTWMVGVVDSWDAHGNIFRHGMNFNVALPNLPGVIFSNCALYNLQTTNYCVAPGCWSDANSNAPWNFNPVSASAFNPQTMAAAANY